MDILVTHCKECHKEYRLGDRHLWKCVRNSNECVLCPPNPLKGLQEIIAKALKEKGKLEVIEGVFGDVGANKGFVEEYVNTENEGIKTKFYGCKQLLKGKLRSDTIDTGATVKRVVMESVNLVLKYKYFLIFILPFWKRIVWDIVIWFSRIYVADLIKRTYTHINQFSPVPKELLRAGYKLAERVPTSKPMKFPFGGIWNDGETIGGVGPEPNEKRIRLYRVLWECATFIQFDTAYYFRAQEFFSNINQVNLLQNSRKEIARVFDLIIEREKQIKGKLTQFKKVVTLLMLFPPIKRLIIDYLMELDIQKFQPDEDDRYFNYRRKYYDCEGKSYEERREWVKVIDIRDGNLIIST